MGTGGEWGEREGSVGMRQQSDTGGCAGTRLTAVPCPSAPSLPVAAPLRTLSPCAATCSRVANRDRLYQNGHLRSCKKMDKQQDTAELLLFDI